MKLVRSLAKSVTLIVCADGGANHARRLGIRPHVILGDFDSITPSTIKYFKHVKQVHLEDQQSTDLEKAIAFCLQEKMISARVVGAIGCRLDHTVGNLGCFKKFGRQIELRFFDAVGELTLIGDMVSLTMRKGEKISLIPLERCSGVTTRNLKYALTNDVLELGVHEGTSNEAIAEGVHVRVKSGTLLLYRFHAK
ncbi:MAG: thiamine diphosphokinase [Ignavibacteria bacterium]|nr:thiamine diphosphokinase [Ignavibacteria bacterium]